MPDFDTPCRHRREPRARGTYLCRSPKLAGTRMVSAPLCRACPFSDHPGSCAESHDVSPSTPLEEMNRLLDGPVRAWPLGWEDWDVTNRAHQLAANLHLQTLPPYPAERFHGRGIVITSGGLSYFPSLYVTVRAIRHSGCTLPIQVWYLGRENELPADRRAVLEKFGVECVDADEVRTRFPTRILNGWELKVYAVLHSRFAEVFSLDADCYPVRDLTFVFDEPGYRETGAVFWPDVAHGPAPNWPAFGVPSPERIPLETGQFVVNKRASWKPLNLAAWYCDRSDWSFLHGYGDKGALEVAWPACGQPFTLYHEEIVWSGHSYLHAGPDGEVLLVHRCRDKFRTGTQGFMTPQPFPGNRFNPDQPLEGACFSWLRELRSEMGMDPEPPPVILAFMTTCSERREVFDATLSRWRGSDWGEDPTVIWDEATGTPSTSRHIATAHRMLKAALEQPADYYLFLENDILPNVNLRHNLLNWAPIRDRWLWMGSLYNPGFRVKSADGESSWTSHVSWANPVLGNFLGAQAIVLSRAALEAALVDWDAFEGNLDIRLAESAVRRQAGVAIHSPSLVQHAAVPSLWNGPVHRAVNFDPFFRAAPVESS